MKTRRRKRRWTEIPGWFAPVEGRTLREYARDKIVLEIGTFYGRSTICLAGVAKLVHAIDPHTAATIRSREPHDSLPIFLGNLKRFKVLQKVVVYVAKSEEVLPTLPDAMFDLVLVDGNHQEAAAAYDIRQAIRLLKPAGRIAVHDYRSRRRHLKGVTRAVKRLLTVERVVQHLAICVPINPTPVPLGEEQCRK